MKKYNPWPAALQMLRLSERTNSVRNSIKLIRDRVAS